MFSLYPGSGLYPQTYVSDLTIISSLDGLSTPALNNWYLYEGNYYVIKTIKKINDQEAELVKERRDLLRKKRREKRHQS